jgi:hypothetical protein
MQEVRGGEERRGEERRSEARRGEARRGEARRKGNNLIGHQRKQRDKTVKKNACKSGCEVSANKLRSDCKQTAQ